MGLPDESGLVDSTRSLCPSPTWPGCAESRSWHGRVLQVLVDEEPGLLGSIVDVEITGSSRWCTFGDIREWVYRCPPPLQPAAPAAAAGVLRARVVARRTSAKATLKQLPPRAAAGARCGHEDTWRSSACRAAAAMAGVNPLRYDGAAGGGVGGCVWMVGVVGGYA